MAKPVSIAEKIKQRWLLLVVGALGVAGVLSVGLAASAARTDYKPEDGLKLASVDILEDKESGSYRMVVTVAGHESVLDDTSQAYFSMDLINEPDKPYCSGLGTADIATLSKSPESAAISQQDFYVADSDSFTDVFQGAVSRSKTHSGWVMNPDDLRLCLFFDRIEGDTEKHKFIIRRDLIKPLWEHVWGEDVEIAVDRAGRTSTFSSPTGSVDQWRYRIIDAGDTCGETDFDVSPNNPAVSNSNRLTVPAAGQDSFRNRWVCLEATETSGEKTYVLYDIDLDNPVVTVRRSGNQLLARSNEAAAWRAGWFDSDAIKDRRGLYWKKCRRAV